MHRRTLSRLGLARQSIRRDILRHQPMHDVIGGLDLTVLRDCAKLFEHLRDRTVVVHPPGLGREHTFDIRRNQRLGMFKEFLEHLLAGPQSDELDRNVLIWPEALQPDHLPRHFDDLDGLALSVVECFETVCGVTERRLGITWV